MATAITNEQRLGLIQQQRFQDMVKVSFWNYAVLLHNNDGTPLPPGLTREEWAMQRFLIAENIVANPIVQNPNAWNLHIGILLEGAVVWTVGVPPQSDYDATIDFMITTGKFDELAKQAFARLSENVKFGSRV